MKCVTFERSRIVNQVGLGASVSQGAQLKCEFGAFRAPDARLRCAFWHPEAPSPTEFTGQEHSKVTLFISRRLPCRWIAATITTAGPGLRAKIGYARRVSFEPTLYKPLCWVTFKKSLKNYTAFGIN